MLPKKRIEHRELTNVKRELIVIERKLRHLIRTQWVYIKNMLKFGFAAWILGLWSFLFTVVITNTPIRGESLPVWSSLLILALATPIFVAAMFSSKFTFEIKRHKRIRSILMKGYRVAMMEKNKNIIVQ